MCCFGTSSGEVSFFTVNYHKCRLEDLTKFQMASSILSMARTKTHDTTYLIIVGLSNGDIYLLKGML